MHYCNTIKKIQQDVLGDIMKYKAIQACLTLLALCVPFFAYANEYPQIQRLKNGLTVLIIEDKRFPIVSTRLYVKAGSSMEEPNEYGISHLLEHMVFKGSKSHPKGIDGMIEYEGGNLNAYTSYDQTVYLNDMPSDKWKLALEGIQGLAFDPLLKLSDLKQEREVVRAELKQRADNPGTQLMHLATAASLKGTTYEHPVIGTDELLQKIQPSAMKAYIKKNYDPSEMLLVVAGDINAQEVFKESEKLFSQYKNLNSRTLEVPYSDTEISALGQGFQINIQKGKWNKSHINISFPIPHNTSESTPAIQMLGILLDFDDNSLLPQELRFKEKIVDRIASYSYSFDRIGLFNIYAQLDSKNIPLFLERLMEILSTLDAQDFTESELNQARIAIENSFWYKNQTVQSMANSYGDLYWSNPADPLGKAWLNSIKNVNVEQINAVIEKYLRPDAMSLSILLPENENLDQNLLYASQKSIWVTENKSTSTQAEKTQAEIIQIANKTLVLTPDTSIPFMSVNINFLGGESLLTTSEFTDNSYNTNAVPTITAEVLSQAVRGMNSKKLTSFLSQKDISISAQSSALTFQISAHGATRFSDDILEIVTDVIYKPAFNKKDIKIAQEEQIVHILSIKDSVNASLGTKLNPFLFPNHPYGSDKNGTEESVNAIKRKDLRKFWDLQKDQAMVISIAGDYNRQEMIDFVESLPNPKASIKNQNLKVNAPTWTTEKSLHTLVEGRNQDFSGIIFPTVDKNHEDAPALRVLAATLDGFNGILFQELREKRNLGYSAGPIPFAGEKAGYLGFSIIASPEHRKVIEEQFIAITNLLRKNGVTDKEITAAKASLKMAFVNSNQTASARAASAANAALFGHDIDYSKIYLDKILKVTKEDVDKVIDKYLVLEKAYAFRSGSK